MSLQALTHRLSTAVGLLGTVDHFQTFGKVCRAPHPPSLVPVSFTTLVQIWIWRWTRSYLKISTGCTQMKVPSESPSPSLLSSSHVSDLPFPIQRLVSDTVPPTVSRVQINVLRIHGIIASRTRKLPSWVRPFLFRLPTDSLTSVHGKVCFLSALA